ncbi:Cro family transcriptional repressor [Pseudomonas protegens]|jgi:DNA-binding transcriptional regulator YdaS (Cro superfamily)|uniref:XRE family transcriptional regulator n=1 Tax=Pseudomonas protegens TaxID=380021 RepID=A0ABY2VNT8_9PSED|nr:Cro/CI family transcriptional regulator [Pseudomonas protegens]ASE22775.1 Cro family transcriptional repressor [Pseudomonas protegens]QEZ53537.1 Cro family transcriptional repressor [Pseudomonas protegens]QEZ60255.1 Cro family transcriptional repressor [Pseudomonas protegens]QEZ64828.1 Cro family transcriptional repressor [Pseudomonas protegens]QIC31287.1 XRE family transcriptional regulator [Pseudomonas protegens]
MKKIPLSKYLEEHGTQSALAAALGVNQSAISQMVRAGRSIEITLYEDGRVEANEIRPIPARPKRTAA